MSAVEPAWSDGQVVADLMLRNPKTLPADASVAEVRRRRFALTRPLRSA